MNKIIVENKHLRGESMWRSSRGKREYDTTNKKLFPWPVEKETEWAGQQQFLNKLLEVEYYLEFNDLYVRESAFVRNRDCVLCEQANVTKGIYNLNGVVWEDSLSKHYIQKHNIMPSAEFIDFIYRVNLNPFNSKIKRETVVHDSKFYTISDKSYVKLGKNQLLILDALLRHGGYAKKYHSNRDKKNKNHTHRNSEHSGYLDFDKKGLNKIIVSGRTNRIDADDKEIYLPSDMDDLFEYEYMYHTHPPTPKPGGRVHGGILYEFPSSSDLLHFIDHYNDGKTQGSIIVASEGLYCIRKSVFDKMKAKININENKLFKDYTDVSRGVQYDAIEKYGSDFDSYKFYSKIAQDKSHVEKLNDMLSAYGLYIDYYPRTKDSSGKWILSDIYLPIYIVSGSR